MKYRIWTVGLSSLVLGLSLSTTAFAASNDASSTPGNNAPIQRGFRGGRMGGLRLSPQIIQELNLTTEQQDKIKAIQTDLRAQMSLLSTSNLSQTDLQTRRRALLQEHQQQLFKVLTPDQGAKLRKLQAAQSVGMGAMMLERMKSELNLTPDQEKKIQSIADGARKQAETLMTKSGGNPQAMRDLRTTTMKQIQGVLTSDQQAKFQAAMEKARQTRLERQRAGGSSNTNNNPQ